MAQGIVFVCDRGKAMFKLAVIREILKGYQLPPSGLHGIPHWGRVLGNGQKMAKRNGADLAVVEYFSVFHDCRRVNDMVDPGHGQRGADLAAELRPKLGLTDSQLEELHYACANHTRGWVEGSLTVRTCWDADRLDLLRVGVRPEKSLLCTEAGRKNALLVWSGIRSKLGYSPRRTRDWLKLLDS